MYAVCSRYTKDKTEALTILNNGFLKVFKNISSFKNEGSFEGWIRRIIYHSAADHFRSQNNNISFLLPGDQLNDIFFSTEENDELFTEDILRVLETLPKTASRAIYLYAIEGYSHREIGEMLEISENTSKWHVAKARNLLKQKLSGDYTIKSISK